MQSETQQPENIPTIKAPRIQMPPVQEGTTQKLPVQEGTTQKLPAQEGTIKKNTAPRAGSLDILRGVAVLNMVAYHSFFNLVWIFGFRPAWLTSFTLNLIYLWQQCICWVFILVSGAALHYGRARLRRGVLLLGCALVLTLVTAVFMPTQRIVFGILHMLGFAMLLSVPLRPLLVKCKSTLGFVLCFALFLFTKTLPSGYLGFADTPLLALPSALYQTAFLFPLGLPGPGFYSGDYFPMLPWVFLFFAGYFGYGLLKHPVQPAAAGKNIFAWLGRHSLLIYMLHQPIIYGAMLLGFGIFL